MPTWLSEGSAVMAEAVVCPEGADWRLERARAIARSDPNAVRRALAQEEGYPEADYALCYGAVQYVVDVHGQRKLYDIMNRLGPLAAPSQDKVLFICLGMDLDRFANEVTRWLTTAPADGPTSRRANEDSPARSH